MGWSVGYHNGRDIGYGVPALCDQPGCGAKVDRGLAYVCGSEPYGGEHGCGLFFCEKHLGMNLADDGRGWLCQRCADGEQPFDPTPDLDEWTRHKMTDPSWAQWRETAGAA